MKDFPIDMKGLESQLGLREVRFLFSTRFPEISCEDLDSQCTPLYHELTISLRKHSSVLVQIFDLFLSTQGPEQLMAIFRPEYTALDALVNAMLSWEDFGKKRFKAIWQILLSNELTLQNAFCFCSVFACMLELFRPMINLKIARSAEKLFLNRVISPLINGGSENDKEFEQLVNIMLIPMLKMANQLTEITNDVSFALAVSQVVPVNFPEGLPIKPLLEQMVKFYEKLEFKVKIPTYLIRYNEHYFDIYKSNPDFFFQLVRTEIYQINFANQSTAFKIELRSLSFIVKYLNFCPLEEFEEIICRLRDLDFHMIFFTSYILKPVLHSAFSLEDLCAKVSIFFRCDFFDMIFMIRQRIDRIVKFYDEEMDNFIRDVIHDDFASEKDMHFNLTLRLLLFISDYKFLSHTNFDQLRQIRFTEQQIGFMLDHIDSFSLQQLKFAYFFFKTPVSDSALQEPRERDFDPHAIETSKFEGFRSVYFDMFSNEPEKMIFFTFKHKLEEKLLDGCTLDFEGKSLEHVLNHLTKVMILRENYDLNTEFNTRFEILFSETVRDLLNKIFYELEQVKSYMHGGHSQLTINGQTFDLHNGQMRFDLDSSIDQLAQDSSPPSTQDGFSQPGIPRTPEIDGIWQKNSAMIYLSAKKSTGGGADADDWPNPFTAPRHPEQSVADLEATASTSLSFEEHSELERLKQNYMLSHLNAEKYNLLNMHNGNFNNNVYNSILGLGTRNLGHLSIMDYVRAFSSNFQSESDLSQSEKYKHMNYPNLEMLRKHYQLKEGRFKTRPFLLVTPDLNLPFLAQQVNLTLNLINIRKITVVDVQQQIFELIDRIFEPSLKRFFFQSSALERLYSVINLCQNTSVNLSLEQIALIKELFLSIIQKEDFFSNEPNRQMLVMLKKLKMLGINFAELFNQMESYFIENSSHFLHKQDMALMLHLMYLKKLNHEARTICNTHIHGLDPTKLENHDLNQLILTCQISNLSYHNWMKLIKIFISRMLYQIQLIIEKRYLDFEMPLPDEVENAEDLEPLIKLVLQRLRYMRPDTQFALFEHELWFVYSRYTSILQIERFNEISIQKRQWAEDAFSNFKF